MGPEVISMQVLLGVAFFPYSVRVLTLSFFLFGGRIVLGLLLFFFRTLRIELSTSNADSLNFPFLLILLHEYVF